MKTKYLIIIVILFLLAITFEVLIFSSPVGENSRLEKGIQIASIFVALLAVVIALSAADPRKKRVDIELAQPYVEEEGRYDKANMTRELKDLYRDYPDPIRSHQVHFKMTNNSDFTLTKPILTFRIPIDKKHPTDTRENKNEGILNARGFNSNLYNSMRELRILEFADTSALSNSNLPYWNSGQDVTIWIRMALDDGKWEPFKVEVSVNCEDANGFTKSIRICPKDLLKSKEKCFSSDGAHEGMRTREEEQDQATESRVD